MILKRESPLKIFNHHSLTNFNGITIQELQHTTKINLRGSLNDNGFISKVHKVFNAVLPSEANTFVQLNSIYIIWLGPNEWLITEKKENKKILFEKLHKAVGSSEASVTDISENRTVIQISGTKIFTLLAKFLTLDFDKSFSKPASVAQTLFVKVPVLLMRTYDDKQVPTLDIYVNRSQANYIYRLIVDGVTNLDF